MPNCFVIQPFDKGKFDKRYKQIFSPAIIAAGLNPYRVDEDVRVDVPIEAIETGIREASVCLADISTNNPNVWYELGFALALGRPVVMVCSTEREGKYPFDIQHRSVIPYSIDAPEDFIELQEKISAKIKALLERGEALRQIANVDPVAPVAGLGQAELTVLATVAGSVDSPLAWVSTYSVKSDAQRDHLTPLGFSLGLHRLLQKSFIESGFDQDYNGNEFPAVRVTDIGWEWIDENESRFVIRRSQAVSKSLAVEITDDDIPF